MYTCIVHREEDEIWERDGGGRTIPSRLEITHSEDLQELQSKVLAVSKTFWNDFEELGADYPSYILFYNGVPLEHLEDFKVANDLKEMASAVAGQMTPYLDALRQAKAHKANEERLARERKAKSQEEIKERDELARLMAKYGG